MEVNAKESEGKLRSLHPKRTFEDLVDRAKPILPQIVDAAKDSDQGLIDVTKMRQLLKIPHNRAYNIRKTLLRELHANDDRLLRDIRQRR